MQDKEFDQLFKDKLEGAELQPSSNLWDKIEAGLEPKKKTSIPVFWMAAAAALVLISAGLLFTNTEKVRLQGTVPLAENLPAIPGRGAVARTATETPSEVEAYSGTPLVIAPSIDVNYPEISAPSRKTDKETLTAVQPAEDTIRPDDIRIAQTEPVQRNEAWMSDAGVLANTGVESNLPDAVLNENDQAEKKGIRNVGDLVNFVVEKVDKREDKLLQFSTDSDGSSSLVGINIGFIKINSRKHK